MADRAPDGVVGTHFSARAKPDVGVFDGSGEPKFDAMRLVNVDMTVDPGDYATDPDRIGANPKFQGRQSKRIDAGVYDGSGAPTMKGVRLTGLESPRDDESVHSQRVGAGANFKGRQSKRVDAGIYDGSGAPSWAGLRGGDEQRPRGRSGSSGKQSRVGKSKKTYTSSHAGWLKYLRYEGKTKAWCDRWFALFDNEWLAYADSPKHRPSKAMHLTAGSTVYPDPKRQAKLQFIVETPGSGKSFLRAPDPVAYRSWLSVLERAVGERSSPAKDRVSNTSTGSRASSAGRRRRRRGTSQQRRGSSASAASHGRGARSSSASSGTGVSRNRGRSASGSIITSKRTAPQVAAPTPKPRKGSKRSVATQQSQQSQQSPVYSEDPSESANYVSDDDEYEEIVSVHKRPESAASTLSAWSYADSEFGSGDDYGSSP